MSGLEKPVWVWLPGTHAPVQCGVFRLENKIGTFYYLDDYKARADALALDPLNLPFTRSTRGLKETRQGGLFGVFRDASPEGFGLALLERLRNTAIIDPMQRLELSEGDAVGAVEVCDDIGAKCAFQSPTSQELAEALASLPPERASSAAAREVKGVRGTSLGGERPKLTVLHQGQQWIAKLQDRGDPPHAPLREYVAMRMARRCGVNAAEVAFMPVGERETVLVKRFDRHTNPDGQVTRKLYASAHTVLRLDAQARGEKQRSYLALAHEVRRWCAQAGVDATELQRELWRRMAFNAIIGNGDDHPRNHGLLYDDGGWTLAPAFDIAPYITFSGTLSMAVTRSGSTAATTANLLEGCDAFGYSRDEALHFIESAKQTIHQGWTEELAAVGMAPDTLQRPDFIWLEAR